MAGGLESTSARSSPHALLCGGGTGGHVFPGLAVAQELRSRGWQVSWAGAKNGIEARLVEGRGLAFHALPARPVVGQGLRGKALAVLTLFKGAGHARGLVRRLDARVVVGTGGYVSAPAVLGGRLLSRPVLLIEPNAEVGLANRLLSRCATEAAVAYDETAQELRCRALTTGVPIRSEFFTAGELPKSPPLRLLALGGSQGARQINELLPRVLARLEIGTELRIVHQAGHTNVEATREAYVAAGIEAAGIPPGSSPEGAKAPITVDVVPFLDDMPAAVSTSHLVISRAGAITLAELCAAGRPALLIPLVLAGGHQIDNARRLTVAGAARMWEPGDSEDDFRVLLGALLSDIEHLRAMAQAGRRLSRPGAAEKIADRVEALGGIH